MKNNRHKDININNKSHINNNKILIVIKEINNNISNIVSNNKINKFKIDLWNKISLIEMLIKFKIQRF